MANASCSDSWQGSSTNPVCTLDAAFGLMSGGDTLIIKDGVYSGENNRMYHNRFPPHGTSENYTIIKAENDGEVIFGNPNNRTRYFEVEFHDDAYVQFEGLVWHSGNYIGGSSYVKFIRCGSGTDIHDDIGINFQNNAAEFLLYEDCYAWGGGRYKFSAYRSKYIIYRRCIGRIDAVDTLHDETKTEPIGGVSIYWSNYSLVQNCIIIDSDTIDFWNYESLVGAFTTPNMGGVGNSFLGCIDLHGDLSLHGQHRAYHNTSRVNCIGWDIPCGGRLAGETFFSHNTLGDMHSDWLYSAGINGYDSILLNVTDSIFFNITTDLGALHNADSDYNSFHSNSIDYTGGTVAGDHDIYSINPLDNSLLYLLRIEAGSNLSDRASDGGDVGATVLNRIGISGTLWGELGYNVTTNESLWPFPNEDLIKEKFSSYYYTNGTHEINGSRGFAADGVGLYGGNITLTSYIWEYLGNPCPSEICTYDSPYNDADLNTDNIINTTEVRYYISEWIGGSATIGDLTNVIEIWKNGGNY